MAPAGAPGGRLHGKHDKSTTLSEKRLAPLDFV
jgi:hypothetical protein